jgi:hypothetical protein
MDFRGTDPNPTGTDISGLIPFIDDSVFQFGYGDLAAGNRIIDSQWATTSIYVDTVMNGQQAMFGLNLADGRIKGYPTSNGFYVLFCRGNTAYGQNDFTANGNGTVTDHATGLMWQQADSGSGMDWRQALAYAENLELGGYRDWRLPNAKELQSLVDYSRSPATTGSAAIDPLFVCTGITNMAGQPDFPWYWTGTTHLSQDGGAERGVYVCFGRGTGSMDGGTTIIDVHGAGCQRSDPKTGNPADYPQAGNGPQGDVQRVFNFVRCVRGGATAPADDGDGDGLSDWYEHSYTGSTTAMTPDGDLDGDRSNNLEEMNAGTIPTDPSSCFAVTSATASGSVFTVAWRSELDVTYAVQMTTDLVNFETIASGIPATPTVNTLVIPVGEGDSRCFYRVLVE